MPPKKAPKADKSVQPKKQETKQKQTKLFTKEKVEQPESEPVPASQKGRSKKFKMENADLLG